jgi:F-box and leucine-rich repeat protein 2/20
MQHIGSKSGGNSQSLVFASIFPNLQLLDLTSSVNISEGICEVLRRCCKIKHLNLSGCYKVKLHSINFVVPKLEVLDLSGTTVDDETLHVISEKCSGLLQIILGRYVTEKGVKHMVEKCTQLREINLGDLHLSDKKRKFFSRRGCLLC